MSNPVFNEKLRRPVIGFTELLKKGVGGLLRERDEYVPFMFRALVIASDMEGGKLETPSGVPDGVKLVQQVTAPNGNTVASYVIDPTRGPRNPKNSVRARIVANNMEQFVDDDSLRTFWPLFTGNSNPSPGELVYVVFEDDEMTHGLWLTKVPTDSKDDNPNQMLMSQVLEEASRVRKESLFNIQPASAWKREDSPKRPTGNRLTALFIDQGKVL
jgi:hypothetical protein